MQWTKKELEDWCLAWCRTPHTTLKAFIDAGFCSDQEPSREQIRLNRPQPAPYTCKHACERDTLKDREAELSEALRWALAELRGQTRYDNDGQRINCYARADAALSD